MEMLDRLVAQLVYFVKYFIKKSLTCNLINTYLAEMPDHHASYERLEALVHTSPHMLDRGQACPLIFTQL